MLALLPVASPTQWVAGRVNSSTGPLGGNHPYTITRDKRSPYPVCLSSAA